MNPAPSLQDIVNTLQERPLCTIRTADQAAMLAAVRREVQSLLDSSDLTAGERLYASLHERLLRTRTLSEKNLGQLLGFLCRVTGLPVPSPDEDRGAFFVACERVVEKRELERARLSLDQQHQRDQALFAGAGLIMFLDYMTVVYLLYARSTDSTLREQVLNGATFSYEGFRAPGIRAGVENDIMVTDFLLRLFAPEPRDTLLDQCFAFSRSIRSAARPEEVAGIVRRFLGQEIDAFLAQGVQELSPVFPSGLGVRTVQDVRAIIEADRNSP